MNEILDGAGFAKKEIPHAAGKAYLFFGEEDYLKKAAIASLRAALCPDEAFAVFNDVRFEAETFTPDALLDAMMPPPMMSEARLLTVSGFLPGSLKSADWEALGAALSQLAEYDYNTVVFTVSAGAMDEGYLPKRPSALLKKLAEMFYPVRFVTPTDAKLCAWVSRHFGHAGVTVAPGSAQALLSFAGRNMFTLSGEIEKLVAYVKAAGRTEVTAADIAAVASFTAVPDAFALSNAILSGDGDAALSALALLRDRRTDPTLILSEISRTLCDLSAVRVLAVAGKSRMEIAAALKMHEYKVGLCLRAVEKNGERRLSRALSACSEADLALKAGTSGYGPIEKLICAL